jgi:SAM-dependent methyltransferase
VCADATRLPFAPGHADGVISVEAAFHFRSRAAFFSEARRILKPGGILTMSDVAVERMPKTAKEFLAGALNVRFWGLRRSQAESTEQIIRAAERAGFRDVRVERCGDRTIDPMVRWCRARLRTAEHAPAIQRWGAARMLDAWAHLRRRGMIEYILLRAVAG